MCIYADRDVRGLWQNSTQLLALLSIAPTHISTTHWVQRVLKVVFLIFNLQFLDSLFGPVH